MPHLRVTLTDTESGPEWGGRILGLPREEQRYGTRQPCFTIRGPEAVALDDGPGAWYPLRGHAYVAHRLAAQYGYVLGDSGVSGQQSWRYEIHRALHPLDVACVAEVQSGEGLVAALLRPVASEWVDDPAADLQCECVHCLALLAG